MKIATIEAIPVSYPEPNDFNALRHLCLSKITADDGQVGWGESITQFPEANFAAKAIIDGMAPNLIGKDPVQTEALWRQNKQQAWWYGYRGGIASYAVAAHRHRALGSQGQGARRERARSARRPGARPAAGDRLLPRAFRVDPGDGGGDAGVALDRAPGPEDRLRQARQRAPRLRARPRRRLCARRCARCIGPDKMLMIDNGIAIKWDVTDAVRRAQAMEEYDLAWIEEPLGAWDPEGYANLRAKTTTRIAYGEREWTLERLRARAGDRNRRRGRRRSRPRRGHHRLQEGHRTLRVLSPAGQRPRLVVGDRHGGEPRDFVQLAGLQALRVQAAAQSDAARSRDQAVRACRRLGLSADRARGSASR